MPKFPLHVVDVFAETRLAGNQLAVVRNAAALSEEQMQAIALEMNFSETTFVTSEAPDRAQVRIFTPAWELPFAGHPTIGTAWVLGRSSSTYTLDLPAGPVAVEFDASGKTWMAPPATDLGESWSAEEAAALVGLAPEDLRTDLPVQFAEVGPRFVLIGVGKLEALKRAALSPELHAAHMAAGLSVQCVFLFCEEAYDQSADFAARMFFDSGGIREDPATGSANTAFADYLRAHRGDIGPVVVDQGVEIGRPSRIYLDVGTPTRVGGRVHEVVTGELTL